MLGIDPSGNPVLDEDGEPVLEEAYSVATGTVLTINTKTKKLYNDGQELIDISASLTPQKMESIRAGGSYAVVFGKKLQSFAASALGVDQVSVFAPSKEISHDGQGLQWRKFLTQTLLAYQVISLHAGSYVE